MKKVKLAALILLLSVTVSIFTGCTLDEDFIKIFNKDFDENSNEDRLHIENESDAEMYDYEVNYGMVLESLFEDEEKNNIYVVADIDTYNEIFKEGILDVNFDEEIIYLHFYRRMHSGPHYLDEISIKDGVLHFYVKHIYKQAGGVSYKDKIFGYYAIRMKKTDVSDFEFHMDCHCKMQDIYS